MKKKFSLILSAAILALCLTACGDSSSTADSSKSESSSKAETTTSAAESSSQTETTTTTTSETTTTTTTTQETTTTTQATTTEQTSKVERVGIPYNAAKIITANANAKLAFATVNNKASDLVINGFSVDDYVTDGAVAIDSLAASSNPLGKAIYDAFAKLGNTNGYVYVSYILSSADDVQNFAQWSEEPTGVYIGQFPDAVNATNWSTIQFGVKQ